MHFSKSSTIILSYNLILLKIELSISFPLIKNDLDFVNSYNIEKFDSKMIVYKVNYSSSPRKFLKDIMSYGINIDTSSTNWKIK